MNRLFYEKEMKPISFFRSPALPNPPAAVDGGGLRMRRLLHFNNVQNTEAGRRRTRNICCWLLISAARILYKARGYMKAWRRRRRNSKASKGGYGEMSTLQEYVIFIWHFVISPGILNIGYPIFTGIFF
ncbi:hypothetical protein B9Z55_004527 [Caenorhabditis nigoni]|uniref:Uncharacterized protein n=1 Tax=Caenorhabditis nigoni TaxID=1611254 RepID=A0A2G5UX94_9PELO|nr:hypothetical protein B9Z55_004527 [Caenorhabditis nigoni]